MKTAKYVLPSLGCLVLLAGCGKPAQAPEPPVPSAAPEAPTAAPSATAPEAPASAAPADTESSEAEPAAPKTVTAKIAGAKKSKLAGTVTLTEDEDGVKVAVNVENAPPGVHATHIHEKADCSGKGFKTAGGHFNPDNNPHGLPTAKKHHLGDLGNMKVGKDGKGTLELEVKGANLKDGDAHSFLGRAIIIHAKKDTGAQPTGAAGARIGCGEIKAASDPASE